MSAQFSTPPQFAGLERARADSQLQRNFGARQFVQIAKPNGHSIARGKETHTLQQQLSAFLLQAKSLWVRGPLRKFQERKTPILVY